MTETRPDGPSARTRHGELSLDEIGEMQMGLARLMREYSDRFWSCYYAAEGGNWRLAVYMLNQIQKLHAYGAATRPKMKPWLEAFEAAHIKPLKELAKAEDWTAFKPAYEETVRAANELHDKLGYAYIEWTLPDTPPAHLRMSGMGGE